MLHVMVVALPLLLVLISFKHVAFTSDKISERYTRSIGLHFEDQITKSVLTCATNLL